MFGLPRGADEDDCHKPTMCKGSLEMLPCYSYTASEADKKRHDCAICLSDFKVGDRCRLLPVCQHSFHALCVDPWLLGTGTCPLCRDSVFDKLAVPCGCAYCANSTPNPPPPLATMV
ncbi:hypothetical protein Tsubulata_038161 [Turnera subulata]|uniref:RING-type E3 ubiquitin transferase n=1 Tax=Turnera subulata TaxID=218843 RepID=A0A9Q0G886_9ROSI|nr:hypothetical protein Tsubulata_038161 [Turnera subulata]